MLYIDAKYVGMLSTQLQQFKKKKNNEWNFRCCFCGDSKRSKTKARGYIFPHKNSLFFKCHNCGESMGFSFFLKSVNPALYKEYTLEKFRAEKGVSKPSKKKEPAETFKPPVFKKGNSALKKLDMVSSLDDSHFVKKYVESRKIPQKYFSSLYYSSNFGSFIKDTKPEKYSSSMDGQERLIIPFFSKEGELIAYQGRLIGMLRQNDIRYITITLKDDGVKIFGMDKVDLDKPIYILEGPIDSMFVKNSIAMAGSSKHIDFEPSQSTFIFDNERRSNEIVILMKAKVHDNFGIMIWPDHIVCKDINELVMNGYNERSVMEFIEKNTYRGLSAEMKINTWKRV